MANRCLNKVMLIGNLTRDPELRYTPNGVAVCSFGLATNRRWTTQDGQTKEEAQFHRIVAWNRLAELCAQLLAKGRRVYVEGRLQYREWTGSDNVKRQSAEVVIEDMIILDSRQSSGEEQLKEVLPAEAEAVQPEAEAPDAEAVPAEPAAEAEEAVVSADDAIQTEEERAQPEVVPEETQGDNKKNKSDDDIPF